MISLLKSMMDLDVSRRDIEYETAEPEGEAGGAESTPKLEGKRRESSAADAFLKEALSAKPESWMRFRFLTSASKKECKL